MKCIINDYLVSISLCSDHEGNGFTHDSVDDTRSQLAARREDCDPSTPRDHSPVPRSVYQKKVQTLLLTKVEGMLVSPTTMTRGLLTGGRWPRAVEACLHRAAADLPTRGLQDDLELRILE